MKKWIFRISILFNILFIFGWIFSTQNSPSYQLGRLEKNLNIGYFGGDSVLFKLPKGLTIRDISQRGLGAIGQFENVRIELVITSDDLEIVNYSVPEESLNTFGNYYSTELAE